MKLTKESKSSMCPKAGSREAQSLMECEMICCATALKCASDGNQMLAKLCMECSAVCKLACQCLCLESSHCKQLLELCAQICKNCAMECEKNRSMECQECAESCKTCAECCTGACKSS